MEAESEARKSSKSKAGRLLEIAEQQNLKLEALCGVTVALAQVPEAVSFALVAGK